MVPEEGPATNGDGETGVGSATIDFQRGGQDRGTDADGGEGDQTRMEVDGQGQQISP